MNLLDSICHVISDLGPCNLRELRDDPRLTSTPATAVRDAVEAGVKEGRLERVLVASDAEEHPPDRYKVAETSTAVFSDE